MSHQAHMRNILLGALCVAACNGPTVTIGGLHEVTVLPAIANRDLDILFVVDNSPSMLDDQQSLAVSFPRMIDVLQTLDGGLPNLHIGVVTSDLGTSSSGSATAAPPIGSGLPGACVGWGDDGVLVQGQNITDRYISDVAGDDGTRTTNYTGALRDAFASLALVGDTGCGFEQHLRAMQRGLEHPANAGFLRADANLAVVIVADEDDCSVADGAFFSNDTAMFGPLQSFRCFRFGVQCAPDNPTTIGPKTGCVPRPAAPYIDEVDPFANALVQLKGDPRKVMVSGIVGDRDPVSVELATPPGGGTATPTLAGSCSYMLPDGTSEADPAVRLGAFFDRFPGRSRITSICDADLSTAVADIGASAKKLMGDPCVDLSEAAREGCEAFDVRDSAPDRPIALPRCGDTSGDCFELVADPVACPWTPGNIRLHVQRTSPATPDTWTHLRC